MKIIRELLATLDFRATVRDVRMGPFQTAVLTRHGGVASTPHDSGPHHDKAPVKGTGRLLDKDAAALAELALSPSLQEAAIGMAAINSLLEVDTKHCIELNAGDLLMRRGEGKKVAIIGHFPFVPRLRANASELWVIEKNPQEDDFTEDASARLIPQADVVGITGTALTNDTIEPLLKLCRPEAYVVILGGTAPLTPLLFDYGVDAVAGTLVTEPDRVLLSVSQGATFRQIKGVRRLTMMKDSRR